jgi:hypothetical protein
MKQSSRHQIAESFPARRRKDEKGPATPGQSLSRTIADPEGSDRPATDYIAMSGKNGINVGVKQLDFGPMFKTASGSWFYEK